MTLLPIVERELRVLSRRGSTHGVRLTVASVFLLILGGVTLALSSNLPPSRLAQNLFQTLSFCLLVLALVSGFFLTADSLSSERRAGTLGLLFLTDLRGWDVVLGKLTTHSLQSVFGFLAAFPMLAIPMLYGGVSGAQVVQVAMALLCALVLSLTLGMAISAYGTEVRTVQGLFVLILLVIAFGGYAVSAMGSMFGLNWASVEALSPFHVLFGAMVPRVGTGFPPSRNFGVGICFEVLLSGIALGLASRGICRRWGVDAAPTSRWEKWLSRFEEVRGGRGSQRDERHNAGLLTRHPFQWLILRQGGVGVWGRLILGIGGFAVVLLVIDAAMHSRQTFLPSAMLVTFGMHVYLKGMAVISTIRRVHEELRGESGELLLVTPLAEVDLLEELQSAFWRQWSRLGLLLPLSNVAMMAVIALSPAVSRDERLLLGVPFLLGIALLWMDLKLVVPLSVWMAFRQSSQRTAMVGGVAALLFPGWVFMGVSLLVLMGSSASTPDRVVVIEILWFVMVSFCWVVLMGLARQRSRYALRSVFGVSSDPEAVIAGGDGRWDDANH